MRKTVFVMMAMALVPFCSFAVDGVVLINQSTVTAAGGFPYTISVAGSYRLSGNLVVPSGTNGIQITASNVTLDLNGFNISQPGNFSFLVKTFGDVKGVTVRNGTISSTAGNMIDFLGSNPSNGASGTVVEDITLLGPNGSGVNLGTSVIARRVLFPGSATVISVTCPAVVTDSLAGGFIRTLPANRCTLGFNSGDVF